MFYPFIAGPYSRTAESRLSELINGGLTTVVGLLGTDGITRRLVKFFCFSPSLLRSYSFVLSCFSLSSLLQKMKVSHLNSNIPLKCIFTIIDFTGHPSKTLMYIYISRFSQKNLMIHLKFGHTKFKKDI